MRIVMTSPQPHPARLRRLPGFIGLALVLVVWVCEPAAWAELRYAASLGLNQQFNSNVLTEQSADAGHDFVTQLSPRIGLQWTLPRTTLSLEYGFGLQVYALTEDPSSGANLMGYDNTLATSLRSRLDRRTVLTVGNQFIQGTENTLVSSQVTAEGHLLRGLPIAGHSFVNDRLELSLSRQLSERWSITPMAAGGVYQVYALSDASGTGLSVPHQYTARVGLGLDHQTRSQRLSARVEAGWLGSQSTVTNQSHPLLSTATVSGTVGWGWQLHRMVSLSAEAGVAAQFAEQERAESGSADRFVSAGLANGLAPVGSFTARVQDGRGLSATLGYRHAYATDVQLTASTTSEDDTVFVGGAWQRGRWTVNLDASYSYMRLSSVVEGSDAQDTALHWLGAGGSLGLRIVDGVELLAGYRFDMLEPSTVDSGLAGTALDYTRHLAQLGARISWPAPRNPT